MIRRENEIVGFIEVSTQPGTKYGMGDNVPEADVRPVISNLAVAPRVRRYGIGMYADSLQTSMMLSYIRGRDHHVA